MPCLDPKDRLGEFFQAVATDEARREQMKADVRASLDAAFRGKYYAATLKKKR